MMDEAGETKDRREREREGNRRGGESTGGGNELKRKVQHETEEERGDMLGKNHLWVAQRRMELRGKR